jgi:NAD(P)-dependent dehydrogenase (short-subunit alcohol dehydrogenase family)
MMHGFGVTGDAWFPLAALLTRDHTEIVPDLRGLELSSHVDGGYDNKDAIVTGASADIGRSTAKLFAVEGAKVIVGACRQAELDAVVAEIVTDGGEAAAPGAVDTAMYREMNDASELQTFMTNFHALKRVATSDELARSVMYLASDDSAFVTSIASLVDGGASITRT